MVICLFSGLLKTLNKKKTLKEKKIWCFILCQRKNIPLCSEHRIFWIYFQGWLNSKI